MKHHLPPLDPGTLAQLANLKGPARLEAAAPWLLAAVEDVLEETAEPPPAPREALARLRLACLSAYVLALGPVEALTGLRRHRPYPPEPGKA